MEMMKAEIIRDKKSSPDIRSVYIQNLNLKLKNQRTSFRTKLSIVFDDPAETYSVWTV